MRIFAPLKPSSSLTKRAEQGGYSFFGPESNETTVKVVIYEHGVGKINGNCPIKDDGVYTLIRVHGETSDPTIGVATARDERFTFRHAHEVDVQAVVSAVVATVGRAELALTATAP